MGALRRRVRDPSGRQCDDRGAGRRLERCEMTGWSRRVVVGVSLLAFLVACGPKNSGQGKAGSYTEGGPRKTDEGYAKGSSDAAGSSATVTAKSVQFRPNPNTVVIGTKVSFVNGDSFIHNLVSGKRGAPDGRFEKELVGIGISLDYTFADPGTYSYHCSIHPDMDGTIIVQ